jgi:hypothetical protein
MFLYLFCVLAFPGFFAGMVVPKVWMCFLVAECLTILELGFIYVIGGSLLQDEVSLRNFVVFLFNWKHAIAFAVMAMPVFAGHLVRRWAFAKRAN